jgi:energy-coupling factor transport system substrate-specific component
MKSMTRLKGQTPPTSPSARALRLRPRSAAALALVSTLGVIAFGWPLLADPGSELAHSADAPLIFALLLPLLLGVLLAEIAEGGLDAKAVALLGVLAAVGAALRPLGGGITGFSPVFLLIVLSGRVLGRGFGFLLGAVTLFASALLTGGVGPWLPFQMLGAAWVGFGAGCLPPARGRRELLLVASYGALSAIAYGFLLNLWFWPFTDGLASGLEFVPGAPLTENLARFLAFCLTTSFGFDVVRALGTFGLVLIVGGPLLRALRRASRRAAFEAPVTFTAAIDPAIADAVPAKPPENLVRP